MGRNKHYKKVGYGSIENQYGVRFTAKQQKEFKNLVRRANYKREKRIDDLSPVAKHKHKEFGVESDFFYRKKSMTMQRFRSEREFNQYMKSLEGVASGKWLDKKRSTYKENYKEKIRQRYGKRIIDKNGNERWVNTSESLRLIKGVNSLSDEDFAKKIDEGTLDPLGEWYKNDDDTGRYLKVAEQLGVLDK